MILGLLTVIVLDHEHFLSPFNKFKLDLGYYSVKLRKVQHCCPFVAFSIAEFLRLGLVAGSLVLHKPLSSLTVLSDIRLGMRRMREPTKPSLRNSAIENATKGQQ